MSTRNQAIEQQANEFLMKFFKAMYASEVLTAETLKKSGMVSKSETIEEVHQNFIDISKMQSDIKREVLFHSQLTDAPNKDVSNDIAEALSSMNSQSKKEDYVQ